MEGHPTAIFTLATLLLPPSKHRWISAALIVQDINSPDKSIRSIIVGDRKGSLHIYRSDFVPTLVEDHSITSTGDKVWIHSIVNRAIMILFYFLQFVEPLCSLRSVHGRNGVTCITFHNGSVYTAGRDGYCRQYHFGLEGKMSELTKFRVRLSPL